MSDLVEKKTKKTKISFVIAGILWILILTSWIPAYYLHVDFLPMALSVIFAFIFPLLSLPFIFPLLSLPFIITGIYTWSTRNTPSKSEKIEELENRLKKVEEEKSKSQNDSSSQDKTQQEFLILSLK